MVSVASYDWESDTWTHNGDNPARTAWHEAVTQVAEKAKATLPECNGRVEKAVQIVLNGDVELLQDGKAKVASQSNGTTQYFVVKGECTCKDYPKAPQGFCMHRLAYGIHKRAYPLAKAKLEAVANGQATPAQHDVPVETPQGIPEHTRLRSGKRHAAEVRRYLAVRVLWSGIAGLFEHTPITEPRDRMRQRQRTVVQGPVCRQAD